MSRVSPSEVFWEASLLSSHESPVLLDPQSRLHSDFALSFPCIKYFDNMQHCLIFSILACHLFINLRTWRIRITQVMRDLARIIFQMDLRGTTLICGVWHHHMLICETTSITHLSHLILLCSWSKPKLGSLQTCLQSNSTDTR